MTPFDPTTRGDDIDVGLGMGVDVDIDVDEEAAQAQDHAPVGTPGIEPDPEAEPAMAYLVKFDPDVTPELAEAVLGELSPPKEGIILAGSGAVILRARQAFVDYAEGQDCVALINAVQMKTWKPNRHRVQADPE